MRKLAPTCGLLLLPIVLSAQSQSSSVPIKLRHLTLVRTSQISAAEQQQIAAEINSLAVFPDSVAGIGERLIYTLQERGFFKASVWDSAVTIVSSGPSEEMVDVSYELNLGERYRLQEITFSNVDPKKGLEFSANDLRHSFPITDGEIFDTGKIRVGLEKLRELYANKGYINFIAVPNTEADDQSATIALRIDLDEGVVYRLGKLVLDGVEPVAGAGANLIEAWKPYEGRVYNPNLLQNFMQENTAFLPRNAQLFPISPDALHRVLNVLLEFDDPPTN